MKNLILKSILEQLGRVYDDDPWYGPSIQRTLKSVPSGSVFDSPGNGAHSMAELLAHMVAWREFTVHRVAYNTASYLPEQEQTFRWNQYVSKKDEAWEVMLQRLDTSQQELLRLLNKHDDSLLENQVAGKPYTFHYLLTGLIQHDVYHLGQIVYIGKLLDKKKKKTPSREFFRYSYNIFPFENLALQK